MKTVFFALIAVVAMLAFTGVPVLADPPGYGGGGGICPNPNAPDDDGDGIPNGQDPDYTPPHDGSGRRNAYGAPAWRNTVQWCFRIGSLAGPYFGMLGWGPGEGTGDGAMTGGPDYGPGPRPWLTNPNRNQEHSHWAYGGIR